jgi:hypothetical protein
MSAWKMKCWSEKWKEVKHSCIDFNIAIATKEVTWLRVLGEVKPYLLQVQTERCDVNVRWWSRNVAPLKRENAADDPTGKAKTSVALSSRVELTNTPPREGASTPLRNEP